MRVIANGDDADSGPSGEALDTGDAADRSAFAVTVAGAYMWLIVAEGVRHSRISCRLTLAHRVAYSLPR